jgi:uncharacterized membrane protein YphA (DoxX/SURF4 family)
MALTVMQRIVWGVRIVLALAFLAAGGSKLAGVAAMIELFDKIGFGQDFRLMVGAIEVFGALLVLIPRTGLPGALWLGGTMVGAVGTHLFLIGGSPVPAIVLGLLCAFVAWRLWEDQGTLIARRA